MAEDVDPRFIPETLDNYRQLRIERGLTWQELAEQHQLDDPHLAGWMREQAALEDPPLITTTRAPRGRTARPRQET